MRTVLSKTGKLNIELEIFRQLNTKQCVAAVCCSVLQRVAACCSVLQCIAVCCSVFQCVAVCCSVLQCVASSAFSSDDGS